MNKYLQDVAIAELLGWNWKNRVGQSSSIWIFHPEEARISSRGNSRLGGITGEFEPCLRPSAGYITHAGWYTFGSPYPKWEENIHNVEAIMEKSYADLGLIHNTEELADYPMWYEYLNTLCKIVSGHGVWQGSGEEVVWKMMRATPRQKIEAILKVTRKWIYHEHNSATTNTTSIGDR